MTAQIILWKEENACLPAFKPTDDIQDELDKVNPHLRL